MQLKLQYLATTLGSTQKSTFFPPDQKYFSRPADENLKGNKKNTENSAAGEFFA